MLVTREVNDKIGAVPGLSVLISYAQILGSVLALVLFVHHAGQDIRASGLIDLVGDRTRDQLEARDRRAALTPDNEGIGSGPDVVMSDGQHASWRGGGHWLSPPAPGGGVKCVH